MVTTDALCTAAVVLAYICIAGVRIDPLVPCRLAPARWMVYVIPVTEVSASPRRTLSSPVEGFAGSTRNVAVARRPGALKQRASSIESPFACGFCACKIGTLQRPASIGPVPDKECAATDALCTATVVCAHSGVAGVGIDPLVPRRFSTIARCVPNVIPVTEGSASPRRTLSSSVEGFAGSTRNVVIATGSSTLKYIASSVVRAGSSRIITAHEVCERQSPRIRVASTAFFDSNEELVIGDISIATTVVCAHSGVACVLVDELVCSNGLVAIARCMAAIMPVKETSATPCRTRSSSIDRIAGSACNVGIVATVRALKRRTGSITA